MSSAVLESVPGQEPAMAYLRQAAEMPHHAYILAGPEGSGKQLAARAFAAALVCPEGGCGACRACRLALEDKHPNVFSVEPEGRDIHVETVREDIWRPLHRTAAEPGRKVFVVREADRLNPSAADMLLKVLEEPPADAVVLLMSARPDELPETILSRCHIVTFHPLAEEFVVQTLEGEGVEGSLAKLVSRLAGGNLGRARRLARDEDGLSFRETAREALRLSSEGATGALAAAELVLEAADEHKKGLKAQFDKEAAAFIGPDGVAEDAFRGVLQRMETRYKRRVARAQRDFIDWVLLAASALLRDRVLAAVGGGPEARINLDIEPHAGAATEPATALGAVEEARAALADETNLNPRLVLEQAFISLTDAI